MLDKFNHLVYIKHGFDGARMQAIADGAGVNKALLHYYYKNKDTLFKKVFELEGREMINVTTKILESKLSFVEKIQKMIESNIDHILKHPELPMFIMREMSRDPSLMKAIKIEEGEELFIKLYQELETAKKNRLVGKHVDIRDLLINIDSMIMYPLIAEPFFKTAFNFKNQKDYSDWLRLRKNTIPIFIKQALQPIK